LNHSTASSLRHNAARRVSEELAVMSIRDEIVCLSHA
jgi:hypothetical protein